MLLDKELENLNKYITESLADEDNPIKQDICDYLFSKSKKIRPSLIFLFAKAMDIEITDKIYHLACCVELIHNSTLIHDDILDNADIRRGKISLNKKLGNNLSMLAGDILLSAALKELVKCSSIEAVNHFSKSLYLMCKGEINQNFNIGKIPSISKYIEKSEYKTAELFKAPLISLCIISSGQNTFETDRIYSFAKNFGIAFQIKDDLLNVLKTDKTKPFMSDINNRIYTAPVIFINEDTNTENMPAEDIKKILQSDKKYIDKTVNLIKKYAKTAIEAIDFIEDNQYKQEIVKITENLYKAGINE